MFCMFRSFLQFCVSSQNIHVAVSSCPAMLRANEKNILFRCLQPGTDYESHLVAISAAIWTCGVLVQHLDGYVFRSHGSKTLRDFHVAKTERRSMLAASKYEEDNLKNGHAAVWGSFYCALTNDSKLCLGQDEGQGLSWFCGFRCNPAWPRLSGVATHRWGYACCLLCDRTAECGKVEVPGESGNVVANMVS